jgi:hypothetical protein
MSHLLENLYHLKHNHTSYLILLVHKGTDVKEPVYITFL